MSLGRYKNTSSCSEHIYMMRSMRLPSQCCMRSLEMVDCAESNMFNIIYFEIDFWIMKQKHWMSEWDSRQDETLHGYFYHQKVGEIRLYRKGCLFKVNSQKKSMTFLLAVLVEIDEYSPSQPQPDSAQPVHFYYFYVILCIFFICSKFN